MDSETRDLIEKRQAEGRALFQPAKLLALKEGKSYPKKHGSVMVYKDEVLEVRYDTYDPNLSVSVNGLRVLEFHSGHIKRFIPDSWVDHLTRLAEPLIVEEKRKRADKIREREVEYLANWGL